MASPIQLVKIVGKTAGSDLTNKLIVLNNVSIANAFRNIGKWIQDIGIGARSFNGFIFAGSAGVAAAQTVTFSSLANNDTVTINGVVYTAKTSGATGVQQFNLGASDTTAAANLAALINSTNAAGTAPAKILGIVSATSAAAVVTLTAIEPGAIGNLYTLAISAHGSVGGAVFASGADGVITPLAKGI